MFDSRSSWAAAGFQIFNRASDGKIMVARHPSVSGLLFKRYVRAVPQRDQLKNYERRLEGARRLRALIDRLGLTRVVVPHKWIVALPPAFSPRGAVHVLVVEQLEILGDEQTRAAYRCIDPDTLAHLCRVLYHFRGMDSNVKNLPFTSDGRIALVDTEHWDRHSSKPYLHHIGEYLEDDLWKQTRKIFRQLEDVSTGRHEEDTSEDFGGDTSSSSS
jgi:hypothetical protein